jgi:hypothetical protein
MRKILLISLILFACEKEGVFHHDASDPRRGSVEKVDARLPIVDSLDTKDILLDKEISITLNTRPDLLQDTSPDTSRIDLPLDATPLTTGTKCAKSTDCQTGFCTDGVCCVVEKCVDTCVPGSSYGCAPYMGFTCAPLGTCRGF